MLESLFVNRFGAHHPSFERLRFLFFVAPLVRVCRVRGGARAITHYVPR
jgi:hypothetical protein